MHHNSQEHSHYNNPDTNGPDEETPSRTDSEDVFSRDRKSRSGASHEQSDRSTKVSGDKLEDRSSTKSRGTRKALNAVLGVTLRHQKSAKWLKGVITQRRKPVEQPSIYLLLSGDDIVYVGRTEKNGHMRAAGYPHKDKDYDSYVVLPVPGELSLKALVGAFVFHYAPKYNDSAKVPTSEKFVSFRTLVHFMPDGYGAVRTRELLEDNGVPIQNGVVYNQKANPVLRRELGDQWPY